jgi:hypothetical protein
MITISYGLFAFILIMELALILLIQWVYKQCQKEYCIKCDYTVISKKTGYEYNCIGIRENEDYLLEIKICNYFTGEYEWHPYYNFIFLSK